VINEFCSIPERSGNGKDYSVDIIIAARNESAHLAECLRMLREQSYPHDLVRIILVDDGSTDDTAEIACRFDVEVLKGAGRGQAAASNMAIRAGSGDLIAFLDAHCIVDANWVRSMASAFTDYRVGGCLSRIDYRADDPRVQALLDRDAAFFARHFLSDTVRGKNNLYPWVIGAACMFRRVAFDEQGGFEEGMSACEDCALSWSVLSLGYQLAHVSQAIAVHYEQRDLWSYIWKGRAYGRGAAELAAKYRLHGASRKFRAGQMIGSSPIDTLRRLVYAFGYNEAFFRFCLSPRSKPSALPVRPALSSVRPWGIWHEETNLQVSPEVVYWPIPEDDASVVVHIPTRTRFVLEHSANVMWILLTAGAGRSGSIRHLRAKYGEDFADSDLDDFVGGLIESGLLEVRSDLAIAAR